MDQTERKEKKTKGVAVEGDEVEGGRGRSRRPVRRKETKTKVRGRKVYIRAQKINTYLKTKSFPNWDYGYKVEKMYDHYNLDLARKITGIPNPVWNHNRKLRQMELGFLKNFWNIFFNYSLLFDLYKTTNALVTADIFYCLKKKLDFNVGTVILRKIIETRKRESSYLIFSCLITHFIGKENVTTNNQADDIKYPDETGKKKEKQKAAAGPSAVAETEEANKEEDKETMPSWAQELFRTIRELSRSNMKLAAEVRGHKEAIARKTGYLNLVYVI
ncbi:hypothetical protein LWI29_011186 [Acer saccharum]|uniref:Putative plant transposon protein domain-containing protein n=1 Tax=Acer saccharum TaxID=4024 RepID=A0AA39RU95_ACESA|nr:hypothetical protein LWI29_011186 [Acer saccharum]